MDPKRPDRHDAASTELLLQHDYLVPCLLLQEWEQERRGEEEGLMYTCGMGYENIK